MPIREESMDLFGYTSSGTYSYYKSLVLDAVGDVTSNVIDLGGGKPASGKALATDGPAVATEYRLNMNIGTACTSAGSATLTVYVKTCDTNSSTANDWTTLYTTGSIALSTLTAGYKILETRLGQNAKRFIKVIATNGTAVFTAGTIGGNIEVVL